jgi:alkaline phosphatase D
MKIIQITDTHLSPVKSHFTENWERLAAWIVETGADLVVHTGDLTIDGADLDDDMVYSIEKMRSLPIPMLIVPGNHDVGHLPGSAQPVNGERLARWQTLVGPDHWVSDNPGWRLIGLNSLIIGSESAEDEAQFQWLEAQLAGHDGRQVAIFAHKPLFVDAADEGDSGYWGIAPKQRQRLFDLFAAHPVKLHASGHLHWAWQGKHAGITLVWGPPSSFVIQDFEREMPGERLVGAVIHTLDDQGVSSEIVTLPQLTPFLFDDLAAELYPKAVRHQPEEEAQ